MKKTILDFSFDHRDIVCELPFFRKWLMGIMVVVDGVIAAIMVGKLQQ